MRVWLVSLSILMAMSFAIGDFAFGGYENIAGVAVKAMLPLFVCLIAIRIFPHHHYLSYPLFFSISLTSLLGLTKTLTGSHAASGNMFLYGLSFYTASLAYLFNQYRTQQKSAFSVSNPLLLVTGPILTQFGIALQRPIRKRISYYFPFVVLGLFLHQGIATPMTQSFFLLEKTDALSSLVFAAIFELFVYANFCGLSLLVFGIFGMLGIKIPLNFRQPFSATNLIDFWKGWHTSLSTVLKALFYTPTRKRFGTIGAIAAVFFASAMWHGVTLNFLVWGGFHALLFSVTRISLQKGAKLIPLFLLIVGVLFGRMIFADSNFDRLLEKFRFDWVGTQGIREILLTPQSTKRAIVLMALFVGAEFLFRKYSLFRNRRYKFYRTPPVQLLLLVFTLSTISDSSGVDYAVYGQR